MLEIIACMFLGALLGFFNKNRLFVAHFADLASKPLLYCILFLLGVGLGNNAEVMGQIASLGMQALALALCSTFMGAFAVSLLDKYYFSKLNTFSKMQYPIEKMPSQTNEDQSSASKNHGNQNKEQAKQKETINSLKACLLSSAGILLAFAGGIFLSLFGLHPTFLEQPDLVSFTFYLLLLCVGVGIGSDLAWVGIIRQYSYKIVYVPVVVFVGSIVGALLAVFILNSLSSGLSSNSANLSYTNGVAISCGFGYYSLSSVLMTKLAGQLIGSITLLANVLRELLSLVATPLLVRWFGKMSPIGAAAATSMDTCLPVIVANSGELYGIIAIFNGMILSLAVPLLLPLFY